MNRKERETKRDLAKLLFVHETLSQKEVATRIGVSEQTVCRWAREDNWDQQRVSITITKETQLRNLYHQLAALNDGIATREGNKYASPPEADTITKLASAIDKMESDVGIADIVSVGKKFLTWLRRSDLKQAQVITPLFDAFIKENLR